MRFAVVDANSIAEFQRERISAVPGHGIAAITHIFKHGCIAVDKIGLILQEWKNTCGGIAQTSLSIWIAGRLVDGNIRMVVVEKDIATKKTLSAFGMPNDDQIYVFTAISAPAKIIVTEDIDFHDPTKKKSSSKEKSKIKSSKKGCVCRHLTKKCGISVVSSAEVSSVF